MGSFFAPETDMIFGDGVGASLVRGPYWQLDVVLCDVDVFLHWNSAAEEGAWVGLKPDLQGDTPVQRKRASKRGQKVDPLEIKNGPLWRVQFWSLFGLHCGKSVEAFISSGS